MVTDASDSADLGAPDSVRSGDAVQVVQLRTTARWLIGGAASVAAILVAGLQLEDLAGLDDRHWWVLPLAFLAALVALAAVGRTLYQAAGVLAAPRYSINDLERRDLADHGNFPKARIENPETPLIEYLIVERGPELLGARDAIWRLTTDYNSALEGLDKAQKVDVGSRNYDPDVAADAAALRRISVDLQQRIHRVCDAAERWETQRRYDRLIDHLPLIGGLFVAGIFAFAWLTTLSPQQRAALVDPIQVQVTVPNDDTALEQAGLDRGCANKVLSGVAVGGTLDAPIVITQAQDGCPAHKITDSDSLVVLPIVDPGAPAK
jgi:hypothetical protein